MDKSQVKTALSKYPFLDMDIERLTSSLETLIKATTNNDECVQAATISDMPRGGGIGDRTFAAVERLLDNLGKIGWQLSEEALKVKHKIIDIRNLKLQIENALLFLTPDEMQIIKLRHFERQSWGNVSKSICISRRHVFRMYNVALDKITDYVNYS
jgi:predicted DNA-binding protein (UPF0251 family)